jgi:N-acetylglucosamine kinase-like BadF-type ATPase
MKLFLGIDGGQSSTTAVIGDETGRVLGMGRGGPCNHVGGAEGRTKFVNAISGCVGTAAQQAGIGYPGVRFEAACAGFSGGPADKQALLAELVDAQNLKVTNDALIALTGATAGEPGIITIAGTGSISLGRNAAGKMARAGGWGFLFGDEGGGFDLARQAIRAALRYEEGWGPATRLHALLLEAGGARDANDLLHQWYTTEWPRPRIARLSKVVDEAARAGDAVARELIGGAAQQLAAFTAAARGQIFAEGEHARVAYIGGVFRSEMLRERFCLLVEMTDGNQVGEPVYGPGGGALLEAYAAAGLAHAKLTAYQHEKADT